jgi:glyoxylase-like metal-dependent hydrolase (beta-lactamase superfamily II)
VASEVDRTKRVHESSDITVIYLPSEKVLIASDVLYHKVHPWLAESRSKVWVQQIEYVKSTYTEAEIVYAGHGTEGILDALPENRISPRIFD